MGEAIFTLEFAGALLLTLCFAAFVFYPIFFLKEQSLSAPSSEGSSQDEPLERERALLAELKEEFDAGKISEESYDRAVAEIKSL